MRTRFVVSVIAGALGVACFDIASGLEHWPFGSYPMYSLTSGERFSWLGLYGVTDQGEIPLRSDTDFTPLDLSRVTAALQHVIDSDPSGRRLPEALLNLRDLHNRRGGVPLRVLRLYRVSWTLRASVTAGEAPRERTLLASTEAQASR